MVVSAARESLEDIAHTPIEATTLGPPSAIVREPTRGISLLPRPIASFFVAVASILPGRSEAYANAAPYTTHRTDDAARSWRGSADGVVDNALASHFGAPADGCSADWSTVVGARSSQSDPFFGR